MAVDDNDPVTGAPIYLEGAASELGVDLTAAGAYAAEVGNRIVKANLAALEAYPYAREGLAGYAEDTDYEYIHDGSGWSIAGGPSTGWTAATPGTNWTATSGYAPQVRRRGNEVWLRGAVTNAGGPPTFMLTIPVGFRPTVRQWLDTVKSSVTGYGPLNLETNGALGIPGGYNGGSFTTGAVVPVTGHWFLD